MTSTVILHVFNLKVSHMTFLTHRQRQLCEKTLFLLKKENYVQTADQASSQTDETGPIYDRLVFFMIFIFHGYR